MSYFYNRPKGFWWWFSRFRTTGVGNSARWDVTYLSLAAVFRRILTTGPLSLELSLCTAQRSPLAPERQPLQKPPAPSQGRLSSSLMWARSKEKWGSRFAVRTLPKGVEGERREPCGCEPLNKGSFSWELKCRVLVPVFSPPGKFLNIPALSYSKEATRGYVSRGEGSGAGALGGVGRHRRDRKPGTEEGCAPTVSVEDGMGAGGVGSQETSKMSWFTCSRESRWEIRWNLPFQARCIGCEAWLCKLGLQALVTWLAAHHHPGSLTSWLWPWFFPPPQIQFNDILLITDGFFTSFIFYTIVNPGLHALGGCMRAQHTSLLLWGCSESIQAQTGCRFEAFL